MCASSALRSSALDGIRPTFRQTPPHHFSSMTAVERPSWRTGLRPHTHRAQHPGQRFQSVLTRLSALALGHVRRRVSATSRSPYQSAIESVIEMRCTGWVTVETAPRTPLSLCRGVVRAVPFRRGLGAGDLRGGARQRRRRPLPLRLGRTSSSRSSTSGSCPAGATRSTASPLRHRSPTSSTRYSRPSSKSGPTRWPHPPAPARTTHRRRAAPAVPGVGPRCGGGRDAAQRRRSPPGRAGRWLSI